MTTFEYDTPVSAGPDADPRRSHVARLTGLRAVKTTVAIGFPPVASGVIARRRKAMSLLEKMNADSMATNTVDELRAEFGSGPVELVLPGRKVVIVLDEDDAARILDETPSSFTPANREKRGALRPFQPRGVLISDRPGRDYRRPVNEAALETPDALHSLSGAFAAVIDDELGRLTSDARRSGELNASSFTRAWWRAVRRITLGDAARDDSVVTDQLWSLRANGNWSYFFPARTRLREKFFDRLYRYAEDVQPNTLMAALDARTTGAATDPVGQIPHWLFAFDASGIATLRAFALLTSHDEQMSRARDEVRRVDPRSPHPLPFLRSCILESLRLWPTTPAILRDSTVDTEWGAQRERIDAGSAFLIYTPAFHRDGRSLAYADAFDPDVWLDGRAESQRGFLPFSSGPAGCPGRNVALFTSSTALSRLVAQFSDCRQTSHPRLGSDRPLPPTFDHFGLTFEAAP
ncbi:cytochrome P450 [Rhodococcus sp. NPDC078407]|uniref:cytochrome P450 n=1 Tax=Rhodococcus sp. NPDC078407 TaxID=3364509 RepID=UPI0037C66617